jgi:hypothetical protein
VSKNVKLYLYTMDDDNSMTQDQQTRKELGATDYAAFSAAAYSEYSLKDLDDRAAATRNRLKEWGVEKGWHMIENPLFANETFTTFINTDTMPHRVVIAARGTDPKNMGDLASDLDIASNKNTTGALQRRVDMVNTAARILTGEQRFIHKETGDDIGMPVDLFMKEDVIFTGHSLGGAIAAQAALQSDKKAVVYNMGSSPFAQIDKSTNRKHRDYDNVVHFTTNRIKDNVLDPVSVSQYADKPGSGIHTISYKVANSSRSLNPLTNHSIDMFKRKPSDSPETGGHDILYDEAVHTLRHSYKYNDRSTSSPGSNDGSDRNRVYDDPDIGTILKNGIIARIKEQAIALAKAKAAQLAAAAKRKAEHDSGWSLAHLIGGIAGAVFMGIAMVVTGGVAGLGMAAAAGLLSTTAAATIGGGLAAAGITTAAGSFVLSTTAATILGGISATGAAIAAVTTIGDDVANWNEKSTTELLLDGFGVAALGTGAILEGASVANAANAARVASNAARAAAMAAQLGEDVAEGASLLNAGVEGGEMLGDLVEGEQGLEQGIEMGEMGGENVGEGDFVENGGEFDNDPNYAPNEEEGGMEMEEYENDLDDEFFTPPEDDLDDEFFTPNENDEFLDDDQTTTIRNREIEKRDRDLFNRRSNRAKKLDFAGRSALEISYGVGVKRGGEDDQDREARKRQRTQPSDPNRGSGTTPSGRPGEHMDKSERLAFVSHNEEVPNRNASRNTDNVGDVPTAQLQFASKSLMGGKGVDITTQIPMVTAAKGNFLRKLAEVRLMY